jgi:hypothetical protein
METLAYRPTLRYFLTEAAYAVTWTAMPGVIVSFIVGPPWAYATGAITAAAAMWSGRRAFRIRLVVTEAEVVVTNYWRTYVIPWENVLAVAMMAIGKFAPIPTGQVAIGFFRRRGRLVRAQATPQDETGRQEFQDAVMAFAPPEVMALTPAPDWWAVQDKPRRSRRS